MPVFPGDPSLSLEEFSSHEKDGFSLYLLKTGLHVGTHLDSPYHFHKKGRKVKNIELEELIGPAQIIDVSGDMALTSEDVFEDVPEPLIKKSHLKKVQSDKILIIKTGWDLNWGKDEYFRNNPYLTSEAAEFLVKKGIVGLGLDTPSVDAWGETKIHEILLSKDIWIVENLKNLDKINTINFEIFLIPLLIDAEGSMIRAFITI